MYAIQYKKDPIKVDFWHYPHHHYRRVSDNLLLAKNTDQCTFVTEARCGLIIWDEQAEQNNDKTKLSEHAQGNWHIIQKWDSQNPIFWREPTAYPTASEVEAYARQIDAYLDVQNIEIKEE